jgi:uncharacterized protein
MVATEQSWRGLSFGVDNWSLDYEEPVRFDGLAGSEETAFTVDLKAESNAWAAIPPDKHIPCPEHMVFVDGTRFIDSRITAFQEDGTPVFGAFSSIAVGGVRVDPGLATAAFLNSDVQRVLGFTTAVAADRVEIAPNHGSRCTLCYQPLQPLKEAEKLALDTSVQRFMLRLEARYAEQQMAAIPDALVVRDGPLLFNTQVGILGYVKTLGRNYLDSEAGKLVRALEVGERTPIFQLDAGYGSPRWVWYLRSQVHLTPERRLLEHALVGIVRLELDAQMNIAQAQRIATQSALFIPHFASLPHKDPRSPQNLIPVGALEKELKRRLGNRDLLRRQIETYLLSQIQGISS